MSNKIKKILIIIFVVSLITIGNILIIKNSINNNKFVGLWTIDGITNYRFNKNNTGYLILPSSNYKFTYVIKKDKILIDFVNDDSEDITYNYKFKNNKLILESKKGKFTFTKKVKNEKKT